MSVERRRQTIEPEHPSLSVARRCELVSISRSSFHCQPMGETADLSIGFGHACCGTW